MGFRGEDEVDASYGYLTNDPQPTTHNQQPSN